MAKQTYKFSDLKQALKQNASAAVVNDIVAHLSSADINKAVQTFDPGLEVTLFDQLTVDSLQKVAQSLDPSVAANIADLPPAFLAFTQPVFTDTAALDAFPDATGSFQATDINNNSLQFSAVGATTTSATIAGITYDGFVDSDYGVLLLDSVTGAYRFMADDDAVNALTAPAFASFTITVSDGTSTTSEAFTISLLGANDAPLVTGAVTGQATEDGGPVALDALANATDADDGGQAGFSVVLPGHLPTGVTYDADLHSFILDPTNAVFQPLNSGDHQLVTVNYGVSDGHTTTPASVSWAVNGVTDAPPANVIAVGIFGYPNTFFEVHGTPAKDYFVIDALQRMDHGWGYNFIRINGYDPTQDVLVFENVSFGPDATSVFYGEDPSFTEFWLMDHTAGSYLMVNNAPPGSYWEYGTDVYLFDMANGGQAFYVSMPDTNFTADAEVFFHQNVQLVPDDFIL